MMLFLGMSVFWIGWIVFLINIRISYDLSLLTTSVFIVLFPLVFFFVYSRIMSKIDRKRKDKIATDTIEYFEEFILLDKIIVDSNIWMKKDYDSIFEVFRIGLEMHNKRVDLLDVQFDEICNIKLKNNYDSSQSHAARRAISRIENFQCANLLTSYKLGIDSNKNAYADPVIIKYALKHVKNGMKVVVVSDDAELRIRVRSLAQDEKDNIVIANGKDLMMICDAFLESIDP